MAGRDGNGVGEDLAGFADLTGVRVVEKPEPQLAVDEHVVTLGKGSLGPAEDTLELDLGRVTHARRRQRGRRAWHTTVGRLVISA